MLTRLRRLTLVAVLGIAAALAVAGPATAGDGTGGVGCTKGSSAPGCDINAGTGGNSGNTKPGNTGGKGGDGKCRNPEGAEIPCQRDGGWAGDDGCYYKPADVSPSTIDALGGQPAGAGGWYQQVCYNDAGEATSGFGGPVWIAGAAPPVVSPEVLARQARSRLNLPTIVIRINPPGKQLTHLPTWLSLDASSWETKSATASVPGVSVTATARPVQATWAMGNNTTKVCTGPGTMWTPGTDPKLPSPDCSYTYTHSSAQAPGGTYTVTVTVTWEVTWAGAGQSGTVPGLTTTGSVPVTVQESQAVITG